MVIDELIVRKGTTNMPIDSSNNQMIDEIEYEGNKYHFAKQKDIEGETYVETENAVAEPVRTLSIEGNTFQQAYRGVNLFDIDNPLLVANKIGTLNDYSPKFENGAMYSGGVVQITAGAYVYIETDRVSNYTISFNADFDEETQTSRQRRLMWADSIVDGIYNSPKLSGYLSVAKGKNSIKISADGYRYIGFASYSTTQYGIKYTDFQIEKGDVATEYEPYVGGIASPNPEYPQEIESSNTQKSRLPSEYQEVEYIESTGTQYIDTGVLADGTLEIYIKTNYGNNTVLGAQDDAVEAKCIAVAGASNIEHTRFFQKSGTKVLANANTYSSYEILCSKDNTTIIYDGNEASFSFDGQETSIDYSIYLFARNLKGNPSAFSSRKIWSVKFWKGGELVRDYVPCYRKSDNIIGLYDLVNSVFYTNAGTGEFLKGGLANSNMKVAIRGTNLFDINNPLIVYPSQYAINQNYTPKIENGVIYSGGVGNSYGAFLCVETDEKSVYTISFDNNFDETTQTKTRCSITKFNGISNGIMSDTVINEKSTVKGKNVFDTYADGYRYIGVAFHSNTKYGMEITNLTIENTITDIVLDCDVSKIKASTNPSTTANYISNVNVENKSITITTPVDIPTTDIGYRGTGVKFNALFPNAEVGKKYLLKFKNSLMGYCRNSMFLTGANPNIAWGNNTVETLTQGMFDAGVVLYGYDIGAHKNTDPLPLPANAIISNITLTEVNEPSEYVPFSAYDTIEIPPSVTLADGMEIALRFAKQGNKADKLIVDRIGGKVLYEQCVNISPFNGTTWTVAGTTNQIDTIRFGVNFGGKYGTDGTVGYLCNKFSRTLDATLDVPSFTVNTENTGNANWINIRVSRGLLETQDVEGFKKWLQKQEDEGDPVLIQYAFLKPKTYNLTNTELGQRLLEWAKTEKGTNIVEITSELPVSKTEMSYWRQIIPNE